MNEVRRLDRAAEAIAVAKEIVERHRETFAEFVTDFDVKLGYSDGDPALFVLFKVTGEDIGWPQDEWQARADAYRKLDDSVLPELIEALDDRFPYSFLVPDWQWDTFGAAGSTKLARQQFVAGNTGREARWHRPLLLAASGRT